MFNFLDVVDPGHPYIRPVVNSGVDAKTIAIIITSVVIVIAIAVLVTILIKKNNNKGGK